MIIFVCGTCDFLDSIQIKVNTDDTFNFMLEDRLILSHLGPIIGGSFIDGVQTVHYSSEGDMVLYGEIEKCLIDYAYIEEEDLGKFIEVLRKCLKEYEMIN